MQSPVNPDQPAGSVHPDATARGGTAPARVTKPSGPDGQTGIGTRFVQRRAGRLLLVAVLVLVGLQAAWLFAANLLLRPGGVIERQVNRKPEKIRIDWSGARSFWPGDLRVENLRIRGCLLTVQWSLSLDNARAQVGLGTLLERCFLARGLVADGAVFHLRRLPLATAGLDKHSVIAPIPWAELTTRPPEEVVKAILAAELRPPLRQIWAVRLPGARVLGVREIWLDEFRYRGDAVAHGSLFVRPKETLDARGVRVDLTQGWITLGEDPVLKVGSGRIDFAFPDVDSVVLRGRAVLQKMEGAVSLEGTVPDIRFANFYINHFPGLDLWGTPGELRVDLNIQQGVAQGQATLGGNDVHLDYRGVALRGDLRIDGRIRRYSLGEKELDVAGTRAVVANVVIDDPGKPRLLANGWKGEATVEEGHLQLGEHRRLEARFSGRMMDSRPLLELFRGHNDRELSALFKSMLSDKDVAVRASVRAGGGVAELDSIEVTGDKLQLLARLSLERNTPPRGMLYLRRGIISVGLETGGDRTVKILNPRKWFDEHRLSDPIPRSR